MSLEEVSASAIRAEIRDLITPTRRQLRQSVNEQIQAVGKSTRLWLDLIAYSNKLSPK